MISAQERGLATCAQIVRQIVPPELEAVIIVYPPGEPAKIASVIATAGGGSTGPQQVAAWQRSVLAASAYAVTKPNNPAFNPQS